jgi:hypothetical protein
MTTVSLKHGPRARSVASTALIAARGPISFIALPGTQLLINTGPGAWNNDLIKKNPVARTIEQAKAAAEADNQRRLDEAKAETAR